MASHDNDRKRGERQNQHYMRLGTRNPKCAKCGEAEPASLTIRGNKLICYECNAEVSGKTHIEQHHIAGRSNDPFTIPVLGNDHRFLSDLQKNWPPETLRNPNGSPLRKAAATLRGVLDLLYALLERVLGWIPEFLEALDERLIMTLGEDWWVSFGIKVER